MTDKVRLPSEPSPLRMRTLRQLDVAGRAEPGRPPGVASASGLIKLGDAFYVAPDDELSLVRIQGDAPGKKLRALPGTLPADPTERKKVKPDFEALCKLPSSERWPHGALLTLASVSGQNRQTS
ncbi:MAG: DUF6929 family protein, partial [Myxococcaceae bacterium]